MPLLTAFELPLTSGHPPVGYDWVENDLSDTSSTTAFNTGLDSRDAFFPTGTPRCVICGERFHQTLDHCHIIPRSEKENWNDLKGHGWIPDGAKRDPEHEPRNGFVLCKNHHSMFDGFGFFIRFVPEYKKFVFVNYSGLKGYESFHGKAIALDMNHRYSIFPSLFIIHEFRVRGFHPFQPISPDMPDVIAWQDWITSDCLDLATDSLVRDKCDDEDRTGVKRSTSTMSMRRRSGESSSTSRQRPLAPLNKDTIAEILECTRKMPSWKACEIEGTSWVGTAEENIKKYVDEIGVEPS